MYESEVLFKKNRIDIFLKNSNVGVEKLLNLYATLL